MWNNDSVVLYFYIGMAILALWAVSQAWRSQANTETIHPFKAFVHLLAFYLSYLLPPLVFFSVYAGVQGYYSIHEAIFVFLVSTVLSYARFIEPHLIKVKTTQYQIHPDRRLLKPVKIALIADLHIGLFSGHERQLKQIVKKLNLQNPDIVVVAGDWTYEPENKLVEELAVLKEICAPVYSVNGNHDEQYPGPPINRQYRANETHQTRQFYLQYQSRYFVLKPFLTAPEWAGLDTVHHDCHLPNTQAHKFLLKLPILRPIYFQVHKSSRLPQPQYRDFAN